MGQRGSRQPEVGIHIRAERLIELVIGNFIEPLLAHLMRGIRNEDVETAVMRDRSFDNLPAHVGIPQVARQKQAASSGCFHVALSFASVVFLLGQIVDRDIGTLPSVHHRDGATDAGVASGDERRLADELVCGAVVQGFEARAKNEL